MDEYTKKFIKLIKECKTDEELSNIINKIYQDGIEDGKNEL